MKDDRLLSIAAEYDRVLRRAEDVTLSRVNRALDGAYKQLERELLRSYAKHQGMPLLANQRRLLVMDEIKLYQQLITPDRRSDIEREFNELLTISAQSGVDMANELSMAIADEPLRSLSGVNVAAIREQAANGATRLQRWGAVMGDRISGVVELSLASGSGPQKLARTLRSELGILKGRAETIARTETMSALNNAAQEQYEEAGLMVQWVVTPSDALCVWCAGRNGNVYKAGSVKIPSHPRCRCVPVPFSERWQKLGLTRDEEMQQYRDRILNEMGDRGLKAKDGLTPFEKEAGLKTPPKPVWQLPPFTPKPKTEPKPVAQPTKSTRPKKSVETKTETPQKAKRVTLSAVPRVTQEKIDKALDELNPDRVALLRKMQERESMQTIVLDRTKSLAPQKQAIKNAGISLRSGITPDQFLIFEPNAKGFTFDDKGFNAVMVYAEGGEEFNPKPAGLQKLASRLLENQAPDSPRLWSLSEAAEMAGSKDSAFIATYIHEYGHLVHARAGSPKQPSEAMAITDYAMTNEHEWFAEHFAVWMFSAEDYKRVDPVGAEFVESVVMRAIGGKT